ncbi:D-arabinitol dehydrogenase 1-like [Schistocerca piceifrons]|uniref:D-arabinitol dehydrogenase 1-like n=1 Tax=Schistocerca piceifrons TaxID=274613 RepID=UPI001F5E8414|nr:D-arabinitol dehydrogenase 1-like [Schistocerca piceifrons]
MVNQTMEALQFNSKTQTLSLVTEKVPSVKENEVLVKVAYAGVCGTDLHIVEGSFPCTDQPVILGHEFSGTVTAVGSKVTNVKVGDKVAVDPNSGCNTCGPCSGGQYHYCSAGGINSTIGIYCNGGWAQYCTAPDTQVYKLPDNIALEQGALTEPISCLSHGWDRVQPIPVGSSILITGAGIIGNLWACLLHVQGHRKVTISEPLESRRKIAEKLGTGFQVVSPAELKEQKEKDPELGFDVAIECSGNGRAMEDALWMLNCGGKLCVFGVASPDTRVSVSPYHLYKQEITIIAVNINPFSFPKALGFIDSMGTRYLEYEKLGIKTFPLKQHKEALEELKKGSIAKAIFKVEH